MGFRDKAQAVKDWATTYNPTRERQQWEKIKTGVNHAGAGMVGLAARSREYIAPVDISPIRFLLFLLIALAVHLVIETQTSNIFSVERVAGHLLIAFILCPFLLGISLRERFEELFTVFLIALFLPLIFMWISTGLSWAGLDVHVSIFSYLTNLFFVPVWIYYAIFQEHVDPRWGSHSLKNFFGTLILLFWIAIILISLIQHLQDNNLEQKFQWGDISAQYKQTAAERVKELPSMFKTAAAIFGGKITELFKRPIQYAVGDDYFIGNVEKSKEEKVGVYLESMRAAAPQFFEDEPVTVWGILKAKTLQPDKMIHVVTECVAIPLSPVAGLQNRIIGDANPENPSSLQLVADVANFEQLDLSCEFPPGLLQRGSRKIGFNTTFNFNTDAYLKSYFMDQDRMRSLVRENINPLTQYGITDPTPIAIYTNGPVGIGMETTRTENGALIPVTITNLFRLGITIENKWEGRIQSVRSVLFRLPAGTHIVADSCDFNVEEVPCAPDLPLCGDMGAGTDATVIYAVSPSSRRDPSGTVAKRGLDVVNRLFAGERRKYVSLTCKISFDNVEAVLGNTPLATQYFKTSVAYDYVLEKSISITLKPVKDFLPAAPDHGVVGPGITSGFEPEPYEVPKSEEDALRKIWQTYHNDIAAANQQSGVPKGLIMALIAAETGDTNPNKISTTGAAGLGQFTYQSKFFSTIRKCCVKEASESSPNYCANERQRCGNDAWCAIGGYSCSPDQNDPLYDDRFNAQHSIFSIAERLATDIRTYNKYAARIEFALVSYNAGGAVVTAAVKQTGSGNPSWPEVSAQITPSLIQSSHKTYANWQWAALQGKAREINNYVKKITSLSEKAEAISEGEIA
ncbi:MAG: hypothetical protein Q7R76_05175 [Candidatus Woesearchaeota archaeon]|nr:hypothetical protein [Candidatus Woesearchaeota archaeon]